MYYSNKVHLLKKIFNDVEYKNDENAIILDKKKYSIVNDVIILDNIDDKKDHLTNLKRNTVNTFGDEWKEFSKITKEHYIEFDLYFSNYDYRLLKDKTFCDFGCGIGRWSRILSDRVELGNLILCDYSDAIFVAREQFRHLDNVIFIKCDIDNLLFNQNSIDFFICLGVLHHLPKKFPHAISKISHSCKRGIIYLYYSLENRGLIFKSLFFMADIIRKFLIKIKNKNSKIILSHFLTLFIYLPFTYFAKIKNIFFKKIPVPLDYYEGFTYDRIRQDAFDRFFTDIEHRYSRKEIEEYYGQYFSKITFSNKPPYWCFFLDKK